MAIHVNKETSLFQLNTENTSYVVGVSPEGYLGHVYYGERLHGEADLSLLRMDEGFRTPTENPCDKSRFLDFFPMEYPTGGIGDYRESCLDVQNEEGNLASELFYDSFQVKKGKPALEGLPASFGKEDEVETLIIVCKDSVLGLKVELSYSVFEKQDMICRSVKIINEGTQNLMLEKVYSACIEMDNEEFELLTLPGSWERERHIERRTVASGNLRISSNRGASGHQDHPFLALLSKDANEERGTVYGMNFVYSGNFTAEAEGTQFQMVRMVMGINEEGFSWRLKSGEEFQAPEVVMTYSADGIGKMTRSYHDFYRNHLIRSKYNHCMRPILINNWEATYFNFNTEKLLAIARKAKETGIEMLVMDDGWFGKRDNYRSSLGDWFVNTKKINGGLEHLVNEVNKIGLKFGIWFEPEMVSPDSDLYRSHPDWAIQIEGRQTPLFRSQYVLDFSRKDVRDYIYEEVANILRNANIEYVKWDMNRYLSNIGGRLLGKERVGELQHRYMLGVYELQERLITEFPDLLLENCASGGGRFDPGMLYYSPQIWCSDDTDAIERLKIQEGTAIVYPLATMGAHVSASPNHGIGRQTPFETRGHVALAGTFGYELDITQLEEDELSQIPKQVEMYHKYNDLVREGDYYRIASYAQNHLYDCWAVSAKDKSEVLVTYVQVLAEPNSRSKKLYLRGFDESTFYKLEETDEIYSGENLQKCGFLMKRMKGDFVSRLFHFIKIAK